MIFTKLKPIQSKSEQRLEFDHEERTEKQEEERTEKQEEPLEFDHWYSLCRNNDRNSIMNQVKFLTGQKGEEKGEEKERRGEREKERESVFGDGFYIRTFK